MKIKIINTLLLAFISSVLVVNNQLSASSSSGILNSNGIEQNGEIRCDLQAVQFKLTDSLNAGDKIEIIFPNEFGTLSSSGVVLKKDNDANPNNGIPVATTTNVLDHTLTITISAGEIIAGSSTIYIDNFNLTTPCPNNILSAKVTTFDNDNYLAVLDYGIVKHLGDTTFKTQNFIYPVLNIALIGANVDFGTLLFETLNVISITQADISSNATDWTLYVSSDHELRNPNMATIPNWTAPGFPGFGLSAKTITPGINIITPYNGTGAISGATNPLASGNMIENGILDLDFNIYIDTLQPSGIYSNNITLSLTSDF